jgi:hypothetical protein
MVLARVLGFLDVWHGEDGIAGGGWTKCWRDWKDCPTDSDEPLLFSVESMSDVRSNIALNDVMPRSSAALRRNNCKVVSCRAS